MTITLYYAPYTRATRVAFLLEELGVPYERIALDRARGDNKTPEYLSIHPHGWVPALRDGDAVLYETAAICLYLADRFPERGLAPSPSSPERGLYYQWMIYAVATLEPALADVYLQLQLPTERQEDPAVLQSGRDRFATSAGVLTQALARGPFLLGEHFSAADILIGAMLVWAEMMGLLAGPDGSLDTLAAYAARIKSRPAFARA